MLTPRKIASNTAWYAIALALQKVISFVYFTILARFLGPQDIGKYFFATSFTFLFAVFTDLGMSQVLTRQVARDKEQGSKLLSQVIVLKILFSLIIIAAIGIISPIITADPITRTLIMIATGSMLLDGFTMIFYAAIRGQQNLTYESIATIIHQAIILSVGGFFIFNQAPVTVIIFSLLAGSIFNFLYSLSMAVKKLGFKIRFNWDKNLLQSLLLLMIPFAMAAVFTRIYAYIDTILLNLIKGSEAVGYYSIAYKITFAFQFLPLAFVAALYPAFSHFWQHDKSMLYISLSKALQYLLIISLPISAGLATLAPWIIPALYTDSFGPAILPLQLLILTLPFLFLNFPLGALLNAANKQKTQTLIIACGMILNIIINLIFIPLYGPIGAAIASVSGTLFIFITSLIITNKLTPYDAKLIITTALRAGLITILMVMMMLWLINLLPWYVAVICGAIFYLLGIVLMKLVRISDIKSLKNCLFYRSVQ